MSDIGGSPRCPLCGRHYILIERHIAACKRKTPEIHTTDKAVFKACRQRWYYSSNLTLNLEPLAPVENFAFGDAIHQALSAYNESGLERDLLTGEQKDTRNRNMISAVAAFEDALKAWYGKLDEVNDEIDEKFDEYRELGLSMLDQYMRFAATRDFFDVLWTERVFHIPLQVPTKSGRGTRPVVYSFRTDGLVRDDHDRIWIVEYKTASNIPDNTDYLLTDDQVGSYIWCLNQLGEVEELGRIEGVLYRWLRKKTPSHMKPLKSGLTLSVDKRIVTSYDIAIEDIKKFHDGKLPSIYREFLDHLKEKEGPSENAFVKQEFVRRNPKEIERIGEAVKVESAMMVNDPIITRTSSMFNCNSCAFFAPCLVRWEGGDDSSLLKDMYQSRTVKHSVTEMV